MTASPEIVALVDEQGAVVGAAPRDEVRRDNLRHAGTAVLVRDPEGRILTQRRTDTKDWAPGHWDVGAGGVLLAGEEPLAGATRELAEELGVHGVPLRPLGTALFEDDTTRCFEYGFEATWAGPVTPQADEVAETRWLGLDGLARLLADPTTPFVPDTRALLGWLADSRVGDYAQLRAFGAALAAGLDFRVTRHGPVRSLAEAAAARGIEPARLLKTMVVRVAARDHRLVLVPGDREIAWPRLRALLGVNRLTIAPTEEATAVTGYERGTITPFGLLTPLSLVADDSIAGPISLGAGAHGVGLTADAAEVLAAARTLLPEVAVAPVT